MTPPKQDQPRPNVSSEVRAWVLAAIVILIHTMTITWWAATLSADFNNLKDTIQRDRAVYTDHEQRIRVLERKLHHVP